MKNDCLICRNHLYNRFNALCTELGALIIDGPAVYCATTYENSLRISELINKARDIEKEIDNFKNKEYIEDMRVTLTTI